MDDKEKVVRVSSHLIKKLREILPECEGESDGVLIRIALNRFILQNMGGKKER